MAKLIVLILCVSIAATQKNGQINQSLEKGNRIGDQELREIHRQNQITQQILSNYLERRLFPFRRPQQRAPSIDEILPTSTDRPLRNLRQSQSRRLAPSIKNSRTNNYNNKRNSYNKNNDEDDYDDGVDVDNYDDEASVSDDSDQFDSDFSATNEQYPETLQSVESEHLDSFYDSGIGIRDYTLATTFPRREFTSADNETSLKDLGLSPTAELLILPVSRNSARPNVVSTTSRGIFDMAYSIIWNLFTPIFAVYGYVKNLIFNRPAPPENATTTTGAEKRANEDGISDHDAAKRRNMSIFETQQPSTSGRSSSRLPGEENKGAYRRVGGSNIHRLHESRDSDDENNTWNGNSTQQQ